MVLLSTHIVSDLDYIADRILIMKNGELIQEGTEKEITDKLEGCVWKDVYKRQIWLSPVNPVFMGLFFMY